jgi:GPH family glycoside/pentoside/hexuronide:cation symporter
MMKGHDTTENKVSIKEQIGYFCGDFGGSLVNLYISAFYLTFCTYVLGISPA